MFGRDLRGVIAGVCLATSLALVGAAAWLLMGEMTPLVASAEPAGQEPAAPPGDPAPVGAVDELSAPTEPEQLPPDTLAIPSLGIRAQIVPVTILNPRSQVPEVPVPEDPASVGISTAGAQPCARQGTTLLVGHVARYRVKGALWPLAGVESGTELFLRCGDGSVATYRAAGPPAVRDKRELDPGINSATGPHRLVVVTCGGPVLPDGHYRDNVVATFMPTTSD